ncbi:MAG: T9SS type A sorting domain-containing protein, partial [Bacteroidota bacterium]
NNGWTLGTPGGGYNWYVEDATGANENSFNTGPFFDNTNFGSPGGIYMYTEASSGTPGQIVSLVSPCIDLTAVTAPRLEFAYHMFGADMGILITEVLSGTVWTPIDSIIGQQQFLGSDAWQSRSLDMSAYAGQVVQIRFLGLRGASFTSDMSIDDITIFQPLPQDASLVAANGPASDCGLTTNETIVGILQNVGADTIFGGVDVNYTINGTLGTATTVTSTIAPDSTVAVSFNNIDLSAPGVYEICIFNYNLAGDVNLTNDTTCFTIENNTTVVTPGQQYFEDFETFTVGTPGTLNNGWTFGTQGGGYNWYVEDATGANENSFDTGPFFDNTNFGTPGGIYMYTEASSGFVGEEVELISPCIDLSGVTGARLEFAYHMYGATMGNLYVDVLSNAVWTRVDSIIGQQQTAGSDAWQFRSTSLTAYAGQSIKVRFVGQRGTSFTSDMSIDDVRIFEPPAQDAAAVDITGTLTGCALPANSIVEGLIQNVGTDSIFGGFNATLTVNGVAGTPIAITDTIAPDSFLAITFNNVDLSVPDTYNICFFVSGLAGDIQFFNDTACYTVVHKNAISSFPYIETFDNPGGVLPAEWENQQDDGPQDWEFTNGTTPVFGTGPNGDHTTGNGFYTYVADGFGATDNDSVTLITPCFDASGTLNGTTFSFWYHSNNANGPSDPFENEMHIDLIYNGVYTYDFIPPIVHKDNNWNFIELNMSAFPGVYAFRFRVNNNNGAAVHDFALDDINVREILNQNAGVDALFSPVSGCGLGVDTLQYEIINAGIDTIFSVDLSYQVNGGTITTTTITTPIAPGNTLNVPLGPVDFTTPGAYNVGAWVSNLTGDTDQFNDSLFVLINSIPLVDTYPYFEDFENGDGGWIADNGLVGVWELAAPNNNVINSAASGVNAWVTNATGLYNNTDNSFVLGPCLDFTNLAAPTIEMSVWWESEFSWDGANLQSSIDGGVTWVNVGAFGDPNNWYTDNTVAGNPGGSQEAWSGRGASGSGGWVVAKNDLAGLGGQSDVRLRVNFGSDFSVTDEGFAFDDIFIYETADDDIAALGFTSPPTTDCSSDSTVVEVQVVNSGLLPQSNIPVSVIVGGAGSTTLTGTIPGPVAPGDTATFVVGTINTNAGGIFTLNGFTTLAGDTLNFNDSIFSSVDVTVRPPSPTPVMDTIILCTPDSTIASVVNDTAYSYVWYADPTGGTPLAFDVADLQTGFLTSDTTLYVEALPKGTSSGIKITEAELLGPDYMEVMNVGGSPVDVTGWTVAFGEDGAAGINDVATTQWDMSGVMQPGEIRHRNDAFGDPNYIGTNIFWNGGNEGWVVILDSNDVVIDVMFFNYTDADIQGFAPVINGTTIDITGQWSGPGIDVSNPVFAQNVYRSDLSDDDDASDWMTSATPSFAGQGTINPGLDGTIGCPSEPRVPITILVAPTVPIDLGPDAVACAGIVVDASDPSIASYVWNTGDQTSSITVNTTGTYYVDVIDNNGCNGSDTINLSILPSPTVDFGTDSIVSCGGLTLDAGNPGSSFVWSVAGQFQQTLQVTTTGTYWVESNLNGCVDSDTVYVEVLPAPAVDLGVDIAACQDVTLDAGNPGATYSWSTGATSQTITISPPTSGTDTITVLVTGGNGCDDTDQIVISAGVPPTVDLGPDATACDSVQLDAGNPGATYSWNTGATSQTIFANAAGTYTVTVTDGFGCVNTDDIDISLEFTPVADLSVAQTFGYTYDFTNLSTAGANVTWDFGDGSPVSTDPNPTHIYAFDGSYTVTLIASNNCGNDTTTITLGSVDIDDLFSQSIDIYPNPTANSFYVNSAELQAENLRIEVYDAKGALIYRQQLGRVNGFEQQIDLSQQPEGVYTVKISDGSRNAVKRVIRE